MTTPAPRAAAQREYTTALYIHGTDEQNARGLYEMLVDRCVVAPPADPQRVAPMLDVDVAAGDEDSELALLLESLDQLDCVMVTRLDQLGHTPALVESACAALRGAGVRLVAVVDDLDTDADTWAVVDAELVLRRALDDMD